MSEWERERRWRKNTSPRSCSMHYYFPLFYIDYIITNIDDVRVVHDWVIVTLKLQYDMKYAFSIEELSELSASQTRLYCFARSLLPNRHHIGHRRFIVAYIMHVNDLSLFFTFWIFGLALWFKWKRKRGKYAAAALSAEVILHKVVKIV